MRIFITGGTGFIGSYVVRELRRRKHRLLILSRRNDPEHGAGFLKGDLLDSEKLIGELKKFKPEAAIHLAWEGIPDLSYAPSVKNLKGGLALFSALADAGCKKIVAAGTGFECGNKVGKIAENINVSPATIFTAAKHSLHILGDELTKEKGMDFIWLRPFNPYGHGQRSGSVIPFIIRCVSEGTPLRLRGPLAQGDFIYITDVARIFADAAERGQGHVTYNVGSGYLTPIREIARLVCKEMRVSKEYYDDFARTAKGKLLPAAYAGISKARKEIGWRPFVNIEKGIKETVKEYKSS